MSSGYGEYYEWSDDLECDEYGIVVNDPETYRGLGNILFYDRSVIFPWTDGEGTRMDILMALVARQIGDLGEGMSTATDLFVATREGMWGFDVTNRQWKAPSYVAEKLKLDNDATAKKLAELINGVAEKLLPLAGYGDE